VSLFVNVFGILQAWQTVLSPRFWGDIIFVLCVHVCPYSRSSQKCPNIFKWNSLEVHMLA